MRKLGLGMIVIGLLGMCFGIYDFAAVNAEGLEIYSLAIVALPSFLLLLAGVALRNTANKRDASLSEAVHQEPS